MVIHIVPVTPVVVEGAPTDGEGAPQVVQPDAPKTLTFTFMDGDVLVTLSFPRISRDRTFQAALSRCPSDADESTFACVTVSLYTAEGEPEDDARLIYPAALTFVIAADAVADLGGVAALYQAYALGGLRIEVREDADDEWRQLPFEFDSNEDGGVSLSAKVRDFSDFNFRLFLDASAVETARRQMSAALGTPTATPTATPAPSAPTPTVTPAPTPTATPTPTPALAPETALPVTGGSTAPVGLLAALALAAALLAFAAVRALLARAGR